ncbi:hypothetical protein KCP76_08120 [Salmonella enterica subsp. enterica serovar Weltevreden]|nr:hypothetical protein KCP76_08120 [Salmonella enterica subsp. enterica serovar Weltevreden]
MPLISTEGASRKQLKDAEAPWFKLKTRWARFPAKADEPTNIEGKRLLLFS